MGKLKEILIILIQYLMAYINIYKNINGALQPLKQFSVEIMPQFVV